MRSVENFLIGVTIALSIFVGWYISRINRGYEAREKEKRLENERRESSGASGSSES